MPAKAPIYLKQNNSKKGKKCRLRDILSPDMISPPLGDFRHTIHIGRGGEMDAFGDMSFLQGKFELLPGKSEVVRPPQYGNHNEFLRANSASDAAYTETPSPVLKNAISLPTIGGCQALTLPLLSSTVFSLPHEPLEDKAGPTTPMSPARAEEAEMLQMDALLRSLDLFTRGGPAQTEGQSQPDVLLDLMENSEKAKKLHKANQINKERNENRKPSPFLIDSSGFHNGNERLNGIRSRGDRKDRGSVDGKGHFDGTRHVDGRLNGGGYGQGNGGFNGNGNCNGCRSFGGGVVGLCCEKELSERHGDSVDRDSGVEEGRFCDLDFDLAKEKSVSHDSLSQRAGSLLSLELDMGPSILDDVLNIMDKPPPKRQPLSEV